MNPRVVRTTAVVAFGLWVVACSSGLGNDPRRRSTQTATNASQNLPLGLDVGVPVSAAIAEPAIAGVVVPALGSTPAAAARDVVLVAFSTSAAATENDGNGTSLSRDTVTDGNSASDVFVAAVVAQDVEKRAFSQSLAGKFRHPRCATCHMMQAANTTSFVSSASGFGEPHAGPPPGPTFPNNDPATCAPCHVTSNSFPVEGWQAPAASFDMRPKSVAQLAQMARNIPADDTEHFVSDRRVLWALDSGVLPQVGGRNGVADDDHDGIVEPEDRDGTVRTVPGGSTSFLNDITNWRATATAGAGTEVETTKAAVKDVTLVSRAFGTSNAANGASTRPVVKFVANPSFTPNSLPSTVGTLFVAFQSTASDLVGGDTNGVSDVFRATVELRALADGSLDLVTLSSNNLACSVRNGSTNTFGNGASGHAAIGGADGELIAFESLAVNLSSGAFTDGNGATKADVWLRNVGSNGLGTSTQLVSHAVGNAAIGGDDASEAPALAASGQAIAFESDATNLVASDTNTQRDVFFAAGATSPFTKVRASVGAAGLEANGASRAASIHATGGRTRVAFESDATNLAATTAATSVFLFDSDGGGSTTLLNQRITATGTTIGNGSARAPVISNDAATVAFESDASNIEVFDTARPDTNGTTDIFLVETSLLAQGRVLPFRITITANDSAASNGASTAPAFGAFAGSTNYPTGFVTYRTAATNLGTSDTSNVMVSFLAETSGVIASFDATPVSGVAPLTVTFTDTSSGLPTSRQWDFDNDGTIDSTATNPTFVFTAGTYSPRLVSRNANSEGTVTRTNLIRAIGTISADFSASVTTGPAPLSVTFTDLSTEQPTSRQWDFENDGTIDSTAASPTFVYTTPGTYAVRLVATNEAGSVTRTKTSFITAVPPTVANFTRTPTSSTIPFAVQFTDTSTGSPTSWAWDFNEDGVVDSTAQNPSFTYTIAGTFDVTLTASGPGGSNTFTFNNCVTAIGNVNASFTISANSAYTTTNVAFTDTSTGTITSWAWDFENNGSIDSTLQNPTHFFSTSSQTTFTVRLTVTGPGGSGTTTRTFVSVAASESLDLTPSQDTTIYSNNTANGNGGSDRLVIGKTWINGFRRALIQFNVSGIPSGSTILTAAMRLTDASPSGTGGASSGPGPQLTGSHTFNIHLLTQSWGEGTGVGSAGIGTSTDAVDTFATMGSNFNATVAGTITISNPPTSPWPLFTSSSLVTNVQSWVNTTPSPNFGWMIKASNAEETAGTSAASIKWVESKEGTSPPVLAITYRRPLPP